MRRSPKFMIMNKLDRFDWRILAAVQREGRIGKAQLAERVGLSPTACWERLKRLETSGVVSGYHARLALEKVAPLLTVMVEITLEQHRQADFRRFEAAIHREPQVVECLSTGGGIDYLMKVMVPGLEAYQALMDRLLDAELGIERYFTYVVTKRVKTDGLPPLEGLQD